MTKFLRIKAKENEAGSRPGCVLEKHVSMLQPAVLPPKHLDHTSDPAAPNNRHKP